MLLPTLSFNTYFPMERLDMSNLILVEFDKENLISLTISPFILKMDIDSIGVSLSKPSIKKSLAGLG